MTKKYSGQSLAIVLVLLLVGSIIGFALYARFVRESERIVDEKASAEANELTETIIGLISTSDYERIIDDDVLDEFFGCSPEDLESSDCRRNDINTEDLKTYFALLGLGDVSFEAFDFEGQGEYCLSEIAMRYGLSDDEITLEQDNSFSLFFNKVEDWSSCSIDFIMTDGGSAEGFVMSTFYGEHTEDENRDLLSYKDYDFDDIVGFSYQDLGGNWTPYVSGIDTLSFPGNYPGLKDGSNLHEVRFKSLGGVSNLRWEVSDLNECGIDNYLVMDVGSTCGGNYSVAKTFVVPREVFAPPIFDYVLFNGKGDLKPQAIPGT